MADLVERVLSADPTLFPGATAARALGWIAHRERYLGSWLDDADARRPRRHDRAILLGMGGSSSSARLYADARPGSTLVVLDTTNPDTVAATDFSGATVIASSKSGRTIETQTLLARALSADVDPADVVVVTDPGTVFEELGHSLGAHVELGDPATGGRFSGLSPFGLIPALYAGWTPDELRAELAGADDTATVEEAARRAAAILEVDGSTLGLGADPATSGGALWLDQLVAETTGKDGRGVIPLVRDGGFRVAPRDQWGWQVTASLLARGLGVDPFDQPDVDSVKRDSFALLAPGAEWRDPGLSLDALRAAMVSARYVTLQVYAPLAAAPGVAALRARVEAAVGPTTANLGPRYLHSTGQLHKGGPSGVVAAQVVVRPRSEPERIMGRGYSFHDVHRAQARADLDALVARGRSAGLLEVEDLEEAGAALLGEP